MVRRFANSGPPAAGPADDTTPSTQVLNPRHAGPRIVALDPSQANPDQLGACLSAFRYAYAPLRKGFPMLHVLLKA
jgi:hypothetical protein